MRFCAIALRRNNKKVSNCFILKAFNFILMLVTIYWLNISYSIAITAKRATIVALSDAK